MEPLEKYYTDTEKEFVSLVEWLKNEVARMKNGINTLPPDEKQFVKENIKIAQQVKEIAEDRRKEAMEEKERREKAIEEVKEPCPKCQTTKNSKVVGLAKNTLGHSIRKLRCEKCQTEYYDFMPIELKDKIAWSRNLLDNLNKKMGSGKTMMEEINYTPEQVAGFKKQLDVMEKTQQKAEKSKQEQLAVEDKMQETLAGMATVIAKLKLRRENFGGQHGMA